MTVFFIDTAHNIIDYIETINKILKPGGVWINLGNDLHSEESRIDQPSHMNLVVRKPVFGFSDLGCTATEGG